MTMIVHCAGTAPEGIPCPAVFTMQKAIIHQERQVAFAQLKHQHKDPYTQSSEPILFQKLRI